jgi:hypothetical protein
MSRGVRVFILVQVPCFLESAKKGEEGRVIVNISLGGMWK